MAPLRKAWPSRRDLLSGVVILLGVGGVLMSRGGVPTTGYAETLEPASAPPIDASDVDRDEVDAADDSESGDLHQPIMD